MSTVPKQSQSNQLVEDFVRTARKKMESSGLTHAEVAEQTGLSRQYIYRVLGGHQNITLDTAQKIAKVLGFSICVKS